VKGLPPLPSNGVSHTKPKVLLADDHARVLEFVSRELMNDFEVVAAVTDGRQALAAAVRLEPDLVVLDITMPELDGFQTARELKRIGSRAKVVFLSLHEADDYVTAALDHGAEGYVLKTRTRPDLVSALDHVMAGRMFVPCVAPLAIADGRGHAVQFYADDTSHLDEVGRFLSAALARGDSIAVVGTEATRLGIASRLNARRWNLAEAALQGRYSSSDAAELASQLIRNGDLDRDGLAEMVDDLDRTRRAQGSQIRLTIFGETSGVLCRSGNHEAALEVERLWDELTRPLPFLTLCTYPSGWLRSEAPPELFSSVCARHSAVSHTASAE